MEVIKLSGNGYYANEIFFRGVTDALVINFKNIMLM